MNRAQLAYEINEIMDRATAALEKAAADTSAGDQPYASLLAEVGTELARAVKLHPVPMHNPHEAHSVIQEEYEEFWDEVKAYNLPKGRDTRPKMREELIQLAAMALRAIVDVVDKPA